tara:strand:- start:4388 stop:4732 length:345 start_codon:yes stop_codon:yes gene_type:complete
MSVPRTDDEQKALMRIRKTIDRIDPAFVKNLFTHERVAFYRLYTPLTQNVMQTRDLTRPYIFTTVPTMERPLPWTIKNSKKLGWIVTSKTDKAVAFGLSEYEAWHLMGANGESS